MPSPVLVVGAGWSGAVVARALHDAGVAVEVVERAPVVGGHARAEVLNGVVYEPNGAHVFHTSDPRIAAFVQRFGVTRPYEHRVVSAVDVHGEGAPPVLLSWPPQVDELQSLADWPRIAAELDDRPPAPVGADFESWVVSLMGRRLYELFVEGYTRKQWGVEPCELSSTFAPERIDLRHDGDRRLFRDRWQFFPEAGMNAAIEAILAPVPVTCGVEVDVKVLESTARSHAAFVITAPLDDLVGRPGLLAWRGVALHSRYVPTDGLGSTITPAYVVNYPSPLVPYTRTIETKHASGQQLCGTVVSEELPGAPARHYPVPVLGRPHERANQALQHEVEERLAPARAFFCGRLATYRYLDQDDAISDALACADRVARALHA